MIFKSFHHWISIVLLLSAAHIHAGDWPQLLGPHRNGTGDDEKLADRWPAGGPREVWKQGVGLGYAGPAVVGDRVVFFHRVGDKERVESRRVGNGEVVWKRDFEATYRGGVNADTGPRCVPVVHQGHVYVYGAGGDLHCVALKDGSHVWSRATYAEYGGDEGYFGAGSTPVAIGKYIIVNVGGRKEDGGIVAFSLDNGKTAWTVPDERASYAAPTSATINKREYAIFVTRYNSIAIDAADGKVLFRFPFGKRGTTVNAATPLVFNDHLFVSSSYGVGASFSKLSASGSKPVWADDDTMSSQYTTAVHHNGFLYGTHGREDIGPAELRCVHAASGGVRWKTTKAGVAHCLLADEKLIVLGIDGDLMLVRPTPEKFELMSSAHFTDGKTRAIPALSNGKLYLRENQGEGGTLRCFDLGR